MNLIIIYTRLKIRFIELIHSLKENALKYNLWKLQQVQKWKKERMNINNFENSHWEMLPENSYS